MKTASRGRLSASFKYVGPKLDPQLAQAVREVDFSDIVRRFPNRTAERYCQILQVSSGVFNAWFARAAARGIVQRDGRGSRQDRYTYRVSDG